MLNIVDMCDLPGGNMLQFWMAMTAISAYYLEDAGFSCYLISVLALEKAGSPNTNSLGSRDIKLANNDGQKQAIHNPNLQNSQSRPALLVYQVCGQSLRGFGFSALSEMLR